MALVAVVPALAVIVYTQATERDRARERVIENALQLTRSAANRQASIFDTTQRLLETLALFSAERGNDPADCSELLSTVLRGDKRYVSFGVANPDGVVFCSTTGRTLQSRERPWFQRAVQTRTTGLGGYQVSSLTGRPDIVMAHPVLGASGAVERVVFAGIGLEAVSRMAATQRLPPGAIVTVFDRNHVILAQHPASTPVVGNVLPEGPIKQQVVANSLGRVVEAVDENDVPRLYAALPLDADFGDTGLYVGLSLPRAVAFVEADRLLNQQLWLLAVLSLVVLAAALLGGDAFVLRPVRRLQMSLERLAAGDFSVRAQLARGVPGLQELAAAVNTMAGSLEHRQREHDREVGERLAAERALRMTEERMRFALEAAQVGIWEANLPVGTVSWSETLEALHGLSPGTFAGTFEAFLHSVHPDDRQDVREHLEQAARRRADPTVLDRIRYRTVWPDGTEHWIRIVGRRFHDESGVPVRMAGIALDVTEVRLVEDQLRQAQKIEAVGQLAGGVAHDFNNLLTVIRGMVDLALKNLAEGEPLYADLRDVREAAEQATVLTRQLLVFSRKQVLRPTAVELNAVIERALKLIRPLIGEHIEVIFTPAFEAGCVMADPGQVEQALINLAVNARDAMPRGGTLTIDTQVVQLDEAHAAAHRPAHPGPYVMLVVRDTGVGMDAATRARIFEPFFTTKGPGRGTGLGLATVHGVVTQSQGWIEVDSAPGRGSTFRIHLPQAVGAEPPQPVPVPTGTRGHETILLVEDEPGPRRLAKRFLESAGYMVIVAGDGEDALSLLAQNDGVVHLVFTDIIMPKMSGRDLAVEVRRRHPAIKILYTSGYTDDMLADQGVFDNGINFLAKPYTVTELCEKVRNVLDQARV
jgi:PAS domain S-box-containing protein